MWILLANYPQDAHDYTKACDKCQIESVISQKHELPLKPIIVVKLFDVWGIEIMGPFITSYGKKYILVVVDYISKWVEVVVFHNNEGTSVTAFLKKNIFSRFGTPWAIISNRGSHFCDRLLKALLEKYGVRRR